MSLYVAILSPYFNIAWGLHAVPCMLLVLKQQEAEQILKWLKKMMGDSGGSNVCQPDGAVPVASRRGYDPCGCHQHHHPRSCFIVLYLPYSLSSFMIIES